MKASARGRRGGAPEGGPSRAPRERPVEKARVSTFTYGGEEFMVFSAPVGPPTCETLSQTERDILAEVADGLSNAEIARKRGTSVHTVSNQVASLYRKTGVSTRAGLALLATRGTPRSGNARAVGPGPAT
jgi:DNA-binding CsgD family transcriptional regulator